MKKKTIMNKTNVRSNAVCLLCAGIFSIFSITACNNASSTTPQQVEKSTVTVSEETTSEEPGVNLLNTMSENDWQALNIFFSNFEEANMEDFNSKSYDEKELIDFAVHHNVINRKHLEDDAEGNNYVKEKYVNATIKKYFGIGKVTAQNGNDGFATYSKGKYFWHDVLEGDAWFAGAQVTGLYDNGNGTLSVVVEDYMNGEEYRGRDSEESEDPNVVFYMPKKGWTNSTARRYRLSGYHAAKIEPCIYDSQKTYKLLEWHTAETLNEARAIVKLFLSNGSVSTDAPMESAKEILEYLSTGNYNRLADMIHPKKGVRFIPYQQEYCWHDDYCEYPAFSTSKLKEAAASSTKYTWGSYDGSGDPIELSLKDYAAKFVYDKDFKNAPDVEVVRPKYDEENPESLGSNLEERSIAISFNFPDSKSDVHDRASLILVFSKHNGKWYLNTIVHNQWTV